MLILREAFYGVSRFEDLRADLRIPRGVLSMRLARLVAQGVLEKHPYREEKARVRHEYRLSAQGHELGLALVALMQWGDRHIQHRPSPMALVDRQTGEALTVAFVSTSGRVVGRADIVTEIAKG